MAASTAKAILFGRATEDHTVHQWPIAVFNDSADAVSYAGMLKIAYTSGDEALITKLDPSAVFGKDKKPLPNVKWSVVIRPYAPKPAFESDDVTVVASI